MYLDAFRQFSKQLGQVDKWLDAAVTYAETKKFDPNLFLAFRLAPDQFALARQIQIACDTAKHEPLPGPSPGPRLVTIRPFLLFD